MKKHLLLMALGLMGFFTSYSQTIKFFDGGGGDNLWSNTANWRDGSAITAENDVANLQVDAVLNVESTISQLVLGNTKTATIMAIEGGVLNIKAKGNQVELFQQLGGGDTLLIEVPVNILQQYTVGYVAMYGSEPGYLEFGPNSVLTLNQKLRVICPSAGSTTMFNGQLKGYDGLQFGTNSNVIFGPTADHSEWTSVMSFHQPGATVTVNMSEGNVFIPVDQELIGTATGGNLIINTRDVYQGTLALGNNAATFGVTFNADQTSMQQLRVGGTGNTMTMTIGEGVDSLFFDNSSAQAWAGSTLAIENFQGRVIRFGEDSTGLTATQLSYINIGGGTPALSNYGFLIDGSTNSAPAETTTLDDLTLDEGFGTYQIDLADYITDADGGLVIYEAASDNESDVTVSISGSVLTLTGHVEAGSANITITATDDLGVTGGGDFAVTIQNAAPVANAEFENIELADVSATQEVLVGSMFSDPGADDLSIVSALSGNEAVATVATSATSITLTGVAFGTTTITVTAQDDEGAQADIQFSVSVLDPANTKPVVSSAPVDMSLKSFFADSTISIASVFSDANGDVLDLEASSGNKAVVTVELVGTNLAITEVAVGTAEITLSANDNRGGFVETAFTITVNANNAPTATGNLTTIVLKDGFQDSVISIADAFADVDADELALSAEIDNEGVATVSLSGTSLTITEVNSGTATITLGANDGREGTATATISLTIETNNAPVIALFQPNIDLDGGFGTHTIDFTGAFSEPDGDPLSYEVASSDESVVTASVSGTTVTLTEVGAGTAVISLTANDGFGLSVTDEFDVEVGGVLSADKALDVVIYPNPATQFVNVQLPNGANYQYDLIDIIGRRVMKGEVSSGNERIELNGLGAGKYILRIIDGKEIKSFPVVKY